MSWASEVESNYKQDKQAQRKLYNFRTDNSRISGRTRKLYELRGLPSQYCFTIYLLLLFAWVNCCFFYADVVWRVMTALPDYGERRRCSSREKVRFRQRAQEHHLGKKLGLGGSARGNLKLRRSTPPAGTWSGVFIIPRCELLRNSRTFIRDFKMKMSL